MKTLFLVACTGVAVPIATANAGTKHAESTIFVTQDTVRGAVPNASDAIADSLSTISTDTGAFAPGRVSFARYVAPGLCVRAAHNTATMARRSIAMQAAARTLRRTNPELDTLPATVAAVARSCGAKFDVARVDPSELHDLLLLTLFEQRDSLSIAVAHRRLSLARKGLATDSVRADILSAYLSAAPARVALAESLVAEVDGMGRDAWLDRMRVHARLMEYGVSMFDRARMRGEADQIIALRNGRTKEEIRDDAWSLVHRAYQILANIAFVDAPDSLHAIAARAKRDLGGVIPEDTFWGQASLDSVVRALSPVGASQARVGVVFPPLESEVRFPAPQSNSGVKPKARVFLSGEYLSDCWQYTGGWILFPEYATCGHLVDDVKRWIADYGPEAIAVTLLEPTRGYALGSLAVPLAEEARVVKTWYQDSVKVPASIVLTRAEVRTLPPPDGRRFFCGDRRTNFCADTTPNTRRYVEPQVVLLDGDNRLLYTGELSPLFEAMLARVASPRRDEVGAVLSPGR